MYLTWSPDREEEKEREMMTSMNAVKREGMRERGDDVTGTDLLDASSPFDELHDDEVVAVAAVVEDEAVRGRGLELEEQVHGVIRLKRAERHVAGARLEGHRVGDDVLEADHGVQLAVVDVAVLAQVDVGHAVKHQALQVADEVGGHGGEVTLLGDDPCLDVVELQLGVVTWDLTFTQEHAEREL